MRSRSNSQTRTNRMYRFCFLVLAIVLAACHSIDKSSKKTETEPKHFVITPYYGIDSVYLGESTPKETIAKFGKAKTQKKWRPNDYPIEMGEIIKIIEYPELGVRFIFDHGNGRFSKKTLREIVIDSTSKIQTPMGNGIGSTLADLKKEFGETKFCRGTFPTFKLSNVRYDLQNNLNHYVMMSFERYDIIDSAGFKVKMIRIIY